MKYVFKMIAVTIVLVILFLQGCQTSRTYLVKSQEAINQSDTYVCSLAINPQTKAFDTRNRYKGYVDEAKRRGLNCNDKKNLKTATNQNNSNDFSDDIRMFSHHRLCPTATFKTLFNEAKWDYRTDYSSKVVSEAHSSQYLCMIYR